MRKNMCICDICGNVFAPNEEIKKDNPFNKDTSRIFLKGECCGLNSDTDYCDVCPECTEKISLYIDTELKKKKK